MSSEKITALLKQIPGPDNQSLKSPQQVEQFTATVAALLAGGEEIVAGLVERLKSPTETSEEDAKGRFALHAMTVHVAGNESQRRPLATALAAALDNDLPSQVPHFVVRQLQVCGGSEVAPALGKLLAHEDTELADSAAQALVAIAEGAAEQLRAALPKTKGANRLVVIQNLGRLRDKASAAGIRASLNDENLDIRVAACRALAKIGDAGSADALRTAASKEQGLARAQIEDARLVLAEKLEATGKK